MTDEGTTADGRACADSAVALLRRRATVLGASYRLFYERPLEFLHGAGVWLTDVNGQRYLDAYNNVPCVGHANPRVLASMAHQARRLNTHTRYLSEQLVSYAERLLGHLPPQLERVVLTCTGSEANDLALRIARHATGGTGFIVARNAYHGVTASVAELSPSLGVGVGPGVRTVPIPIGAGADAEAQLTRAVTHAVDDLRDQGIAPAGLLLDTVFSSEGIVPQPEGMLRGAVDVIHRAGGVFIADEVQAGFARLGPAMWGFERHSVLPDIVTLGKPMGNGYPLAGLVARADLADAFGSHVRYFNTFGGNPVACAAGHAVLDEIEERGLRAHVGEVGEYLVRGLRELRPSHPSMGEVRGSGLFVGVDVADGPAVSNGMRERRVLVGTCGPDSRTVKIRPPLVFGREHADRLVEALDETLTDVEHVGNPRPTG